MKRRTVLLGLTASGLGLGAATYGVAVERLHRRPRPLAQRPKAEPGHGRPRVLMIGNSMVLRHDVPGKLREVARADGVDLEVIAAAANGARLIETARLAEVERLLAAQDWSVLVLQGFTKMPLRSFDRWGAERAITRLARRAGAAHVVLYPPWPAAPGSEVYRDAGFLTETPASPAEFARQSVDFYADLAETKGYHLAPVPTRWLDALSQGAELYAEDGHHANAEGAALAAKVLWSTMLGFFLEK